ncbi:hypothetical protein PSET11_01717 [Arthrobacter ulcerisalmonis]|uniref:Uncharacterized protein n=1 Tax=Arthrobacter ulcerisalmonis TaxID=2483813 RepID=A0A3P5WXT8_9MICC|nr:hypothetical protein [Arthrobacter ulcerisalmonis]VDC26302.1 hypothetical protein PSET11_01717 [Arthrobacter ulcerisalmonis]
MTIQDHHSQTNRPDALTAWIDAADISFNQEDLVAALQEMTRSTTATALPAHDQAFWAEHSGIDASRSRRNVAARNAANRVLLDSSTIPASAVAERMELSASTVRHYKAAHKLYSYLVNGKLAFPDWQFINAGKLALPALEDVLAALPSDLHPQSVAGFFLTPQPDLVLNGEPVSAKAWLAEGGNKDLVVSLAKDLAAGN